MASKRKKNGNGEGPVKIVGINHGLCLAFTLFLDGWKRERFADVTFYCKPSTKERNNRGNLRKKLRANRSVLAAASPFLASILPDCELENDVCITTELLYDEMFCVLEYIYSGKLLCSADNKEKLLNILKDFKVFVPGHIQDGGDARDESEIEIVIEEGTRKLTDDNDEGGSPDHLSDTNSVHIDLQLDAETLEQSGIASHSPNVKIMMPDEQVAKKDPPKIYAKKKAPVSSTEHSKSSLQVDSSNEGIPSDHLGYMKAAPTKAVPKRNDELLMMIILEFYLNFH